MMNKKSFMMKFYLIGKKHNFLNILTTKILRSLKSPKSHKTHRRISKAAISLIRASMYLKTTQCKYCLLILPIQRFLSVLLKQQKQLMERIHLVNKAIYVGISICVAKISGCTGSVQFNLGGIYTSTWIKSLVPYLRTKQNID